MTDICAVPIFYRYVDDPRSWIVLVHLRFIDRNLWIEARGIAYDRPDGSDGSYENYSFVRDSHARYVLENMEENCRNGYWTMYSPKTIGPPVIARLIQGIRQHFGVGVAVDRDGAFSLSGEGTSIALSEGHPMADPHRTVWHFATFSLSWPTAQEVIEIKGRDSDDRQARLAALGDW